MTGNLCIAVLEDNLERREAMFARLHDRFPQFQVQFFHEPIVMIAHLKQYMSQTALISLDHDLDLIPRPDGTWHDPGTGMDLVNFLTTLTPVCPIVIHSSNLDAARAMKRTLKIVGWDAVRVTPCDDLSWIDDQWFETVRNFLLKPTIQSALPRTLPEPLTSVS